MKKRLEQALFHDEPLYVTPEEWLAIRRWADEEERNQKSMGVYTSFLDPLFLGQLQNLTGVRVVIDSVRAKEQAAR